MKKQFLFLLLTLYTFSLSGATKDSVSTFFDKQNTNVYWVIVSVGSGKMEDASQEASVFHVRGIGSQAVRDSRYLGYEIKFAVQPTSGLFASLYRFPKYGVGVFLGDFHNPNIGYPIAVYGWAEAPFTRFHKLQKFTFGLGGKGGVAFNFNPYDKKSNPTNIFIGSSTNYIASLYLFGDYRVSRHLCLGLDGGFLHFSNSGWKQPNIGVNIFAVSTSLKYQINPLTERIVQPIPKYAKHWKMDVKMAVGRKQNGLDTPYSYKWLIAATPMLQLSHAHSIGAGMEATLSLGRKDDGSQRTTMRDVVSPSAVACWDWFLTAKFATHLGAGGYLFPNNTENGEQYRGYAQVGVKYYLSPHVWTGVFVKGHTNLSHIISHFSEFTVGYTLR